MSERPDQPDRWLRFANLRALAASLPVPAPDLDADDLDALNPWITAGRYPDDFPDLGRDEAEDLCSIAQRVLAIAERLVVEAGPPFSLPLFVDETDDGHSVDPE